MLRAVTRARRIGGDSAGLFPCSSERVRKSLANGPSAKGFPDSGLSQEEQGAVGSTSSVVQRTDRQETNGVNTGNGRRLRKAIDHSDACNQPRSRLRGWRHCRRTVA